MARHHHRAAALNLNLLDNFFSSNNKNQKQQSWPKVEVPSDFIVPEPRPLTITESTDLTGFVTASTGLALRLATGAFVLGWKVDTFFAPEDDGNYYLKLGPIRIRDSSSVLDQAVRRPEETIVLYGIESSPRCKRVREMMNLLDITYECRPCFGENNNDQAVAAAVPYIDDPNIDRTISGDDKIIEHLLEQYGPPTSSYDRKALWPITFQEFSLATSQLTAMLRGNPGATQQPNSRPDNANMKPLELWAYECSPFVQPVKEKLASLGLPHRIVSCSRGSKNRDRMVEKTGRFQVPYLVDSNTGIDMFEGAEIVEYLEAVYTVKELICLRVP
eukprot:CAMPEP_0172308430 /NCGR_PEP_ID=MMETSP1058-20130122/9023_1 /TAXON_ID=83371 /ORGANISM="Detonula confervacea, Strain CCMP 353" /LENGTH=330 /DNA_ID=CAMNT_0013020841 /DNA_START=55 /DNA_END=1044 /DNA_ORIENTATION=-